MFHSSALPPPNRVYFWLAVVFVLRLIATGVLFWLGEYNLSDGLLGNLATDAQEYYINTAKNVAHSFTYAKHQGQPYAGHMPGYDVVIAPLLWLFSETVALNILWVLQWLFGCITTYLLARISYQLFNKELIFIAVIVGYGLNTYVTYYDFMVLTESFAISSLITGIFLYLRGDRIRLLLAGGFFTWSFFLRPYLLPVFFLFGLGLLWQYRSNLQSALVKASFFACFFVIAESVWLVRNYIQFNRFVPVIIHEQLISQGRLSAIRGFMKALGGDDIFWNPTAEVLIFFDSRGDKIIAARYQDPEDLPAYMFTDAYNADSLRILSNWYARAESDASIRAYADSIIVVTAEKYRQSFITEKPFLHYIVAPIRLLGKFLLHSGTYNLAPRPFFDLSITKKTVKIVYSGLYYFTWVLGMAGCFLALLQYSPARYQVYLMSLTALYPLFLFPIVFRSIEYRYFTLAYPFLFVMAVWFCFYVLDKLRSIKP